MKEIEGDMRESMTEREILIHANLPFRADDEGQTHPFDGVFDSRYWKIRQRSLIAVQQRLTSREDPHQHLKQTNYKPA